jgi:hypothetical protein
VELRRYLQASRDRLVSVLDGLDEHDVRRPLTPTGTNLLGLVKHLIGIELGYLGSRSPSPNTTAGAARFAIPRDLKNPTVQELTTRDTRRGTQPDPGCANHGRVRLAGAYDETSTTTRFILRAMPRIYRSRS